MGSEEPSRYGGERYVHYREDLRLDAGLDVPKTWEKAASRVAPAEEGIVICWECVSAWRDP